MVQLRNKVAPSKVLYITENSTWGKMGYKAVSSAFSDVTPLFWSPEMEKPDLDNWHGDWIISFKSDLILPLSVIENAQTGSINFHPCPPKYRGIGGYWWAIHNEDDRFGVTCHHMNEHVDHGNIIRVTEFPVWIEDTVDSLKYKAGASSLNLLNDVLSDIVKGKALEPSGEQWGKHLYTRKELKEAQAREALKTAYSVKSL